MNSTTRRLGAVGMILLSAALPGLADASGPGAWVGEPRLELAYVFGGARTTAQPGSGYQLAFGFASRVSRLAEDSGRLETRLPLTGLALNSNRGFSPLVLGIAPEPRRHLAASEEDAGISWSWVAGAVAAAVAVAVLVDSDDEESGSNGSPGANNSSGGSGSINGIGPGDGDGECDVASSSGGGFTLVEGDECTGALL